MRAPQTQPDHRPVAALRGPLVHCLGDPDRDGPAAVQAIDDGMIVLHGGHIRAVGHYDALAAMIPAGARVDAWPTSLIVPGLVDAHVHFPQLDVIASHGAQLLDWLTRYVFPAEARFADPAFAAAAAETFLDALIRHGTTTALVFCTVHPTSAEALFAAAHRRNVRLIAGKVLMDRHAPAELLDTAEQGIADSDALIRRWHGRGRLGYALTPRFAPTSSPRQLGLTGRLLAEHADVLLHTHLSENRDELAWVAELFPDARDYLDVYDRFGLVTDRSVFAHGVHLDRSGLARLAGAEAALAHCPSSNLFLGSGLFDLAAAEHAGVRVGLGSDVGAGTSLSMLATMGEAYKVAQVTGHVLSPAKALYLATQAPAQALRLDDRIGNFQAGKEADILVLDPRASPLLRQRLTPDAGIADKLFALSILGDDRAVAQVYLQGVPQHAAVAPAAVPEARYAAFALPFPFRCARPGS
ncbi:MAG: guanine deaminase [Rhodothalassiaceae bacterium]